jgi:hypothetical protein
VWPKSYRTLIGEHLKLVLTCFEFSPRADEYLFVKSEAVRMNICLSKAKLCRQLKIDMAFGSAALAIM